MSAVTVTSIVDGKQAHAFPSKEVVGLAQEKIDFTVDNISIPTGDTYTIQIAKVAAGQYVKTVKVKVTTAEGDAITGELGDGDDPNGWITSVNLNSATIQHANGQFNTDGGKLYAAADTIDLVIANSSGSTYTLDAAKFTVYIEYFQ